MSNASDSDNAAEVAEVYRPLEALKNWARANKDNIPEEEKAKLQQIIAASVDEPDVGRPLAVSTLQEGWIRQIFRLGPDKALDITLQGGGAKGRQ
jgi:hypothetical protein